MKLRYKNDLPAEGLNMESLMETLFYRDEFLAIASHELKTPLTSIKLQAQVFKRQDSYSKEKVDRMVDQIDRQTSRLIKIVEDMLDISRIRSGQFVMTKASFNLSQLIGDTLKEFDLNYGEIRIDKDIHFVGDKDRLKQVLHKLLNNAARYGKALPVDVKLIKKKSKITFSVADRGEGISEEDQSRIFHRFQRAVAASEVCGLGLGLFIAREIVESHGGKIFVKSEIDEGSTFWVDLKSEVLV